jgi:site-specific DNA recombinase
MPLALISTMSPSGAAGGSKKLMAGCYFVGASATGYRYRYRYRYRYYTCFSRQRYGTRTCGPTCSSRPSRPPPPATTASANNTTMNLGWSRPSYAAPRPRSSATWSPSRPAPSAMPSSLPGSRPSPPRLPSWRTAKPNSVAAIDSITAHPPTEKVLAQLRERIHEAITHGPRPAKKALVQALVHEIRVESRDVIIPTFRVPTPDPDQTVRTLPGLVGLAAQDANLTPLVTGPKIEISEPHNRVRRHGCRDL